MSNDKIINKQDLLNDLPSAVTIYNTVYNLQEIEKKNLLAYNEKQCFKKSDLNKAFFYSTYVKNQNKILSERDFFHIYGNINDFLHPSLEFKFKTSYIASTLPKSINLSIGIHANKDNVIQITESKEKESFNIFYLFTKGSIEDDNLIQKLYGIKLNYKETIEDADGNIYYHYTLSGVTESEITDDLEFYGYDDYNNLIKIYPDYPLEITDSPLLESIEQTEIAFDNNQPGIRDISSSNLATIWTEDYIRDIHKDDGFDDYNLQIANYFTLYYDKPIYDYDRLDFSKNILLYEVKEEDVTNWEKGEYSFPNKSI